MKELKKLHKGMSLVEVLVAMTVFSVGTAAVTMAFATAVKYNTHNQRRDDELSAQQNIVQNGRVEGLELYEGSGQDHTLVFTKHGTSDEVAFKWKDKDGKDVTYNPYKDITEFAASRTGKNDGIFDFQLKSFSSTIGGNGKPATSKDSDTYRITVINEDTVNYDVRVSIDSGKIYQGSLGNGYMHSSNLYCRSLSPKLTNYTLKDKDGNVVPETGVPSKIMFGYQCVNLKDKAVSPMTLDFYKDGFHCQTINLNVATITGSTEGHATFTIEKGGKVRGDYE